jgi:probable rRNA maturation factor
MAPEGQRRTDHERGRPRRTRGLRVVVSDDRGRPIRGGDLGRWLARVAPAAAKGIVGVVIAADARVRALNRQYRGIDQATDVLSFPAAVHGGPRAPRGMPRLLGDIVIARGVAGRQARHVGHSQEAELRVLALHGLLHLLGYDHDNGKSRMARAERHLRRKGGLQEGLIERAGRS